MMKKIIYFCLISILALNFNCSKDDFFAEEESKIDKNTESNEKFAKETITQKRKSSNRSPKVTSSNVILIRFSPSASANQIHNITNSIAPTSAIQCPNGDQIWTLNSTCRRY